MVEVKQSAKPLGFANGSFPAIRSLVGEGNHILKSLMISLALMELPYTLHLKSNFVKSIISGTHFTGKALLSMAIS